MKVTNLQLINSIESLNVLNSSKLPAKTSFRLSKLIRKTDQLIKLVDKAKLEVCKKYAAKDESGEVKVVNNQATFLPDFKEVANKELAELMAVENDLGLDPIDVDDLGNVELAPQHFIYLDWLIV